MEYGVFSANQWIYPDGDPAQGKREVELLAAGDSVACAQILCDSRAVSWEWSPRETANGTAVLGAPQVNRLISVYVGRNTAPDDSKMVVEPGTQVDHVTRLAPFEVFDAMEPAGDRAEAAESQMLGLYLRWPTYGMKAGLYEGDLVLTDENGDKAVIKVQLEISAVRVPKERTLRVTYWFDIDSMADYHGVERWSEEHWQIIETYGRIMYQLRQTDFIVRRNIVGYRREEDGSYTFDFDKAKRLIRLYLSLGMKYINVGMLYYRKKWSESHFVLDVCGVQTEALSEEGYRFAQAYHTQWYQFLRDNGWLEIALQHVGDEPHDQAAPEYRILSGMVRKWMPGIRIADALGTADLDGAVDVWIIHELSYVRDRERFDQKRDLGDTFWYYTSCTPGGEYLNRLLDKELLRTRYLYWANRLYNFTGYLHWGLNQYTTCRGGVYTGACDGFDRLELGLPNGEILPAGDSHILYPKGRGVLTSVRYEMMRAGCEDYELLCMLGERSPEEAREILLSCVCSFTDYTTDVEKFERAYKLLLEKS